MRKNVSSATTDAGVVKLADGIACAVAFAGGVACPEELLPAQTVVESVRIPHVTPRPTLSLVYAPANIVRAPAFSRPQHTMPRSLERMAHA